MFDDYQFDDAETAAPASPAGKPAASSASFGGGNGGSYADEIWSKKISAKFRTFYVDLKESVNGKFVKISEKSRGKKSTIMMDAEDVPAIVEALQEVQKQF